MSGAASVSPERPPRTWTITPHPWPEGAHHPGGFAYLIPGAGAALAWLRGHAVQCGHRLGLVAANTPGTLALLQAAALGGVTVVLFNRRLDAAALAAQSGRAALDAWVDHDGNAQGILPELRRIPAVPDLFFDCAEDIAGIAEASASADPERPALVLFTSGTSGVPKAARLSVRALRAAAVAATGRLALTPHDLWVACLGLDHIGGASFAWRAGISGHLLVLVERFDALAVTTAIDAGGTGISVVPTMLHRLLDARGARRWPASLRVVLTGGGPLADALAARSAGAGVEPSQTYGLSECASQVCTMYPADAGGRGCAGAPLPGVEVRIVADTGIEGASAQSTASVGRIDVRGPILFSGYEDHGAVIAPQTPDAWFSTGDLGDIDASGRLRVHCRRTDLIVSGGENVYPAEIEAVLAGHPQVRLAAVWGEADDEWGQVVTAAVVADGVVAEDFSVWMATRLPGFKRPRRWAVVAALPLTATGKIERHRLPGWLQQAQQRAG
jgi:O-succinylbenzoic acid--CoA ligase